MTAPVLFQFMPPLLPSVYSALAESIREHGVQVPIVVDEHGVVIDGHHRKAIAQSLGVHCPQTRIFDKTDTEKRTLALTLNLDRRNLTREERRAIVEASVKADPQLSDREHARRTGADHKTVGTARAGLVGRGEIPHVPERTDSLGRQQPATKPERIDLATGEVLDEPEQEFHSATGERLPVWNPHPKPAAPRRKALPEQFMTATLALTDKVAAIVRLAEDDRFTANTEKVALANRSDLIRAIDALAGVVAKLPERNNS